MPTYGCTLPENIIYIMLNTQHTFLYFCELANIFKSTHFSLALHKAYVKLFISDRIGILVATEFHPKLVFQSRMGLEQTQA